MQCRQRSFESASFIAAEAFITAAEIRRLDGCTELEVVIFSSVIESVVRVVALPGKLCTVVEVHLFMDWHGAIQERPIRGGRIRIGCDPVLEIEEIGVSIYVHPFPLVVG